MGMRNRTKSAAKSSRYALAIKAYETEQQMQQRYDKRSMDIPSIPIFHPTQWSKRQPQSFLPFLSQDYRILL